MSLQYGGGCNQAALLLHIRLRQFFFSKIVPEIIQLIDTEIVIEIIPKIINPLHSHESRVFNMAEAATRRRCCC